MEAKFTIGDKVAVCKTGVRFCEAELGKVLIVAEAKFGLLFRHKWAYRVKIDIGIAVFEDFETWYDEDYFRHHP